MSSTTIFFDLHWRALGLRSPLKLAHFPFPPIWVSMGAFQKFHVTLYRFHLWAPYLPRPGFFCNAIARGSSTLYRREANLHEYSYSLSPQQLFLKTCLHSTSGIGLETCILFAKEGANVLMADISAPALEKASTKLKQLVPSAHKVEIQVRFPGYIKLLISQAIGLRRFQGSRCQGYCRPP